MLENGLGELFEKEVPKALRFVDLFSGSGAVAARVSTRFPIQVLAFDLQRYSAVLTAAVIDRNQELKGSYALESWIRRARKRVTKVALTPSKLTRMFVADARAWSEIQAELPITKAYGGHYFSPQQSVWIDALRATLPKNEPSRTVALAALIRASSACVAAPGHTAQPFQPTATAKRYLAEAWSKDVVARTIAELRTLAAQFAVMIGKADVADANDAAKCVRERDLVFIDPPYSGVHYSRFYHVLETIAQGCCGEVSGIGRYPAANLRPRSKYSVGSESAKALGELFQRVASNGARAIVTFPDHTCSNGLSGNLVREIAGQYFTIREQSVKSRFSSLGGTGDLRKNQAGRAARKHASELILFLEPK